jgi:hypothetical protein
MAKVLVIWFSKYVTIWKQFFKNKFRIILTTTEERWKPDNTTVQFEKIVVLCLNCIEIGKNVYKADTFISWDFSETAFSQWLVLHTYLRIYHF